MTAGQGGSDEQRMLHNSAHRHASANANWPLCAAELWLSFCQLTFTLTQLDAEITAVLGSENVDYVEAQIEYKDVK